MDVLELATSAEDQVFDVLNTAEQIVVDALKSVADVLEPLAIEVPVPFADQLPTATQVVDHAFNLAEKVLANQRSFAHKLLALSPYTGATVKPAPKAATKPAKPTVVADDAKSA